ncbi:ABC transporter permease [Chachezhania sediminis]|uniref:ABC transporter permease n=1 Tax=Chachezhania sediminis TaxID=2599291 RepID=UPI0018EED30A|nr:ABC transporter permease [Chachezhania sediminis]
MKPALDPAKLLMNAYVALILAFLILPILIILPMAFSDTDYLTFPPQGFTLHWFGDYFGNSRWMKATGFSLKIAALTAVITAAIATAATYALVRGAGRLGALFQGFLIMPIVVPHIALAVALYLFFQRTGLANTVAGYVMAHSVIAMPFAVFTIAAAMSAVDPTLEDAAMSCGASRFSAFRLVTLPLILPNVLSGGLFAFILSFDEPVITFFLAGIRQKTLPRMMFDNIEQSLTPTIPAIAVLLTAMAVLVLVAAGLLRRVEARRRS